MTVEGRLAVRVTHLDNALEAAGLLSDLLDDTVEVVALDLTKVQSQEVSPSG